jgi:hypothetical protein
MDMADVNDGEDRHICDRHYLNQTFEKHDKFENYDVFLRKINLDFSINT